MRPVAGRLKIRFTQPPRFLVQCRQHTLVSLRYESAALKFRGFFFILKARYGKPPLSVEDQLKLLESRGMRIADTTFAAHALSTVSYYRLSAYSYPFSYRETANFAAPIDNVRFSKTLTLIDEETVRSNEEFVAHFRKTYDTSDGSGGDRPSAEGLF